MNKMKPLTADRPDEEGPIKEDEKPRVNPASPEKPVETPTPTPIKVPEKVPADVLSQVELAMAA